MGSQSSHLSTSTTQNPEIDHYVQFISEHKKKILSDEKRPSNQNKCMSCGFFSEFLGGKVDWQRAFIRDCNQLKEKFYWAFFLPELLKKHLDQKSDQLFISEFNWAYSVSDGISLKRLNKPSDISLSNVLPLPESVFESKNYSFKLEREDFNNASQKTEKKLEKSSQNAVNIFQLKDNISCIEHNSTILKIDEKAISLNFSTQHDFYDFSCPSKFIKYEDNSFVLDKDKKEKLLQNELYSEAVFNFKRATNMISKQLKDPNHPLNFLKSEYLLYFVSKYQPLTHVEFRTSTSHKLITSYQFMLNDIRQFVRVFKSAIQNFYDLNQLEKPLKALDSFTHDNLIDFVLNLIFTDEIYNTIFDVQRKIDKFNEIIFKRNLKDIKDSTPDKSSVPEKFCLTNKTINFYKKKSSKSMGSKSQSVILVPLDTPQSMLKEKIEYNPYKKTIEMLKNLNFLKSPAHKLKLVVKACENIPEEINEFLQKHDIEDKANLNNEDLLSILVFIATKLKINSLISHCNFMEKFLTQTNLTGKNGYYFYMFKAAVEYILNSIEGD